MCLETTVSPWCLLKFVLKGMGQAALPDFSTLHKPQDLTEYKDSEQGGFRRPSQIGCKAVCTDIPPRRPSRAAWLSLASQMRVTDTKLILHIIKVCRTREESTPMFVSF